MSQDIDTFISELAKKAQAAYKSYNTTTTSNANSSVSSTQSSPSNTTSSNNQSTNANMSSESSWTPSMVGLNFGYQPKITYNPISGTPMQSTVGGA